MMHREKTLSIKALFHLHQQTESSIMNIIFDLSGVIFGNTPVYNSTHQYGATVLSPIHPGTTLRLLQDCITKGHRLFVLSNMSESDLAYLQHHPLSSQILDCFQDIILGPAVGIKKPDPRIFSYLIDKHGLNEEHSIFIDDQIINLEAAHKAGISKNIHCNDFNFSAIRKELEHYGAL